MYIARKYDKLRKRLGFVTFRNVDNPVGLDMAMKDVWIGSYKLYIVLARLVDGENMYRKEVKEWKPVNVKVSEKKDAMEVETELIKDRPGQSVVLVDSNIAVRSNYDGCGLIGRVIHFYALTNLRGWLSEVFKSKVAIKHVGVLFVILVFGDSNGKEMFLQSKEVFNDIGSKFGVVVQSPSPNEEDEDLSYVLIGVLCKSVNRIHQVINLKWKDISFPVMVEEESGDWIPDCLDNFEVIEEDALGDSGDDTSGDNDSGDQGVILEGAGNLVHDQPSNSGSGLDGNLLNIKDTFNQHSNDGSNCKEGLKKRGNGFRKMASRTNSVSPVCQERPKKRPRENEDPFDVGRFIFAVNPSSIPSMVEKDRRRVG
ncbi:hypothetical protein Hanom_Chr12g01146461 [Helianthus anomalus]